MANFSKLSIIIPVYNEEKTLAKLLDRVLAVDYGISNIEIITVNDASADKTDLILQEYKKKKGIKVLRNKKNLGKSQTVRRGILESTGDLVVIQDADLEYDPQNLKKFIHIFQEQLVDVIYGNRFGKQNKVIYLQNWIGNTALSFVSSFFTFFIGGFTTRDMEVCYKMARGEVFRNIAKTIESKTLFGLEPEITAKFAKYKIAGKHLKYRQVPIDYSPRSIEEGKHMKAFKHGYEAIKEILFFNIFGTRKISNLIKKNIPKIVFWSVCVLYFAKALSLLYPDFINTYPFMFPDSWQWISDGYYFVDQRFSFFGRNPGLPLLISVLIRADLLFLLPVFNTFMTGVFLYTIYKIGLYAHISKNIMAVSVFIFSFQELFQTFSISILADIYSISFIGLSILFFIKGMKEQNKFFIHSIFFSYLSLNFQYAGFLLLLTYGIYIVVFRRTLIVNKSLILSGIFLLPIIGWWYIWRHIQFGDPNYSKILQWELIDVNWYGIPYYLYNFFVHFGIPVSVTVLLGIMRTFRNKLDPVRTILLIWLVLNFIFWGLFYSWLDPRFLLYSSVSVVFLFGFGMESLIKELKNKVSTKPVILFGGIYMLLCVLFIQYKQSNIYFESDLLLVPGISLVVDSNVQSNGGIRPDFSKISVRHDRIDKDRFGILEPFIIRYRYIRDANKNDSELSEYVRLNCNHCSICLHPDWKKGSFEAQRVSLITKLPVKGRCRNGDVRIMEGSSWDEGEVLFKGSGYTLYKKQ